MRLIRKTTAADGVVDIKVSVSTSEDLWHLYNFILCGDRVRTKTKRKVAKETSTGKQTAEVKTVTLEVEVHQVDFAPDELRLHGVNVMENDFVKLGAHHTLSIHTFPPQDVTIIKKDWDAILETRLKEACDQESRADTAAVVMDYGTANVLIITPSFIHTKAKIEVSITKKHKNDATARDKSIQRFFKQVLDALCTHVDFEKMKLVLLCSPAHVREEFRNYMESAVAHAEMGPLRAIHKNMAKTVLVRVNDTTHAALREAFTDPTVANKMESTRCSDDIKVWQSFQDMLNKDPDRCVYTPQIVFRAALMGAIGTLMISDSVFRSENPVERRFYLALVQYVRNTGGRINVFSSNHVTGEQLTQLGSIASILLFACPELDDVVVVENFINGEEVAAFIRENVSTRVTV